MCGVQGGTVLQAAAAAGHTAVVRYLVETAKVGVNERNSLAGGPSEVCLVLR